jgi:hypothetical protein
MGKVPSKETTKHAVSLGFVCLNKHRATISSI